MSQLLLKRARKEGTPLIDGQTVLFVWRGQNPPGLIGDFNDWDSARAVKLKRAGPEVWIHRLRLPRDAYLEYAYVRGDKRLADPFNPRTIWNGVEDYNHFFYMPGAAPIPLAQRQRDAPRGTLTRHVVAAPWLVTGWKRTVYLYQPPAAGPCPLLVVYDGNDYLRRAQLVTLVENLMAQGRIRPVALALLTHGAKARFIEYACSESTLAFVLSAVLPLARAELNLIEVEKKPGAFGVLGASMGGLMALYTGMRFPKVFGRVLSQSGAFTTDGFDQVLYDLVRDGAPRPLKIWMDVGRYDFSELLRANRRMRDLLIEKGYAVTYREYNAGHNYSSWRDEVWRGLEALFGLKGK